LRWPGPLPSLKNGANWQLEIFECTHPGKKVVPIPDTLLRGEAKQEYMCWVLEFPNYDSHFVWKERGGGAGRLCPEENHKTDEREKMIQTRIGNRRGVSDRGKVKFPGSEIGVMVVRPSEQERVDSHRGNRKLAQKV